MSKIIIIGAGKRVSADVIPIINSIQEFEILGIYAQKERDMISSGISYKIRDIKNISGTDIQKADFLYVCVPPKKLSEVLSVITPLSTDPHLIVDTPILPWKQSFVLRKLRLFKKITVAEDIVYLPWIQTAQEVIGDPKELIFHNAVYRYHGIALIKKLVSEDKITRAKLAKEGVRDSVISIRTSRKTSVIVHEPRDYEHGFMKLVGTKGFLIDKISDPQRNMYPVIHNHQCIGIQLSNNFVSFSETESMLIGHVPKDSTITSLTLSLKRIGLRTILKKLIQGETSERSLRNALNDVRLDEKIHYIGRWISVSE